MNKFMSPDERLFDLGGEEGFKKKLAEYTILDTSSIYSGTNVTGNPCPGLVCKGINIPNNTPMKTAWSILRGMGPTDTFILVNLNAGEQEIKIAFPVSISTVEFWAYAMSAGMWALLSEIPDKSDREIVCNYVTITKEFVTYGMKMLAMAKHLVVAGLIGIEPCTCEKCMKRRENGIEVVSTDNFEKEAKKLGFFGNLKELPKS